VLEGNEVSAPWKIAGKTMRLHLFTIVNVVVVVELEPTIKKHITFY
jgi:hypothetical protein